jgi:uncharacterized membrane protein YfcA
VHFSRFVNYVVTIRLILVQSVTDILPDMDLSFAASLLSSPLSLSLLWPLLLGALLGGIGGLLGIGGGIIAIPVLAMGFGMEQQLAQGTALVMITPNVLIAFWRYRQRHHLPLRTAGLLGLATLLATWPAAWLAVHLDSHVLMLCFAVFLVGLALWFFHGARERQRKADERRLARALAAGRRHCRRLLRRPLRRRFRHRRGAAADARLRQAAGGGAGPRAGAGGAGRRGGARHLRRGEAGGLADRNALLAIGGMATVSYGVAWAHRLPEKRAAPAVRGDAAGHGGTDDPAGVGVKVGLGG